MTEMRTPKQGELFPEDHSERENPKRPFAVVDDATRSDLLVSVLSLASVDGVGIATLAAMFDTGFLPHVWDWDLETTLHEWMRLPVKSRADLAKSIHENRGILLESGHKASDELRRQHIHFVPLGHESYPARLQELADPPRWLFVKGDLDAVKSTCAIAVVGTRDASEQGRRLAYRCAEELARRDVVVLSGLARGIDEWAHLGAVESYGQSIAVLGHGVNPSYLSSNHKLWARIVETEGAIVSEYPPLTPPRREYYLRRNELVAALARVVIPIECPTMASGTGATIRRAMSLGTPISGVIPANSLEPTIAATARNLAELGLSVFTLSPGGARDFWDFLEAKIPNHPWTLDSTIRQDRLLRVAERMLLEARSKVPLDEDAIDRLAQALKDGLASD